MSPSPNSKKNSSRESQLRESYPTTGVYYQGPSFFKPKYLKTQYDERLESTTLCSKGGGQAWPLRDSEREALDDRLYSSTSIGGSLGERSWKGVFSNSSSRSVPSLYSLRARALR